MTPKTTRSRRWLRALGWTAPVLGLLAGCAVGPNYSGPPDVETPTQYKGAGKPPKKTAAKGASDPKDAWTQAKPRDKEPRGPWWEIFHDPTLNSLETNAMEQNQDLRVAISRIGQSRAQARYARADFFPNFDVNTSGGRMRTTDNGPIQKAQLIGSLPGLGGGGASGGGSGGGGGPTVLATQPVTTTQNDWRAPVDLNWELDLFGRVRRTYEAARADAQAVEADYHSVALSVTANVAISYFNLRALDTELGVLERTIATRKESLGIAQERLEAGLTSELDVVRARSDLASNEADLFSVQRTRAEAENALATLLGRAAPGFKVPRRPLASEPPRVPAGLPSNLLERRPDVAAAERNVAAYNARVGIAVAAFFPQIRLTGAAGFESADIGSLFDWPSRMWQIGPSIHIPIFEGGRNTARLEQTRAQYDEQVARYRQQVLVAFQDVENALADIRTLAGQLEAQNRAVAAARRAFDLSNDQYRKGAVNFLDVIDAERTVLLSERTAALLQGQRMQASVQLVKALGGGWEGHQE